MLQQKYLVERKESVQQRKMEVKKAAKPEINNKKKGTPNREVRKIGIEW